MSDLIWLHDAVNVADIADYTGLSVEDVKKVTDEVVKGLKALQTVDAVPVIRCKDCSRQCICYHSANYYCADGEKVTE